MKTTERNEILQSLRGEGLSEEQAHLMAEEIDDAERWLGCVASAKADPAMLNRVHDAVIRRVIAYKRFTRMVRFGLAVAAGLLIAMGVWHVFKSLSPMALSPVPMQIARDDTEGVDDLTITETVLLDDDNETKIDDVSFTELVIVYEDMFDQNENWLGMENSYENQSHYSGGSYTRFVV
jgi:hypothetical protein